MRRSKKIGAAFAVASLLTVGAMMLPQSAMAGVTCTYEYGLPILQGGGTVTGDADISCNSVHDSYTVEAILQHQRGDGTWADQSNGSKDCGSGLGCQDHTGSYNCISGALYRIKLVVTKPLTQAGSGHGSAEVVC